MLNGLWAGMMIVGILWAAAHGNMAQVTNGCLLYTSTGCIGPNACGAMGYSFVDAHNAGCVIVVTDNLVEYPCVPASISQQYVDFVVKVDQVGDPEKIGKGAARLTKNPRDLMIAERTVELISASRRFKNGFSFQTGAGAIPIAITRYLAKRMKERGVKASFALGGIPAAIIDMYDEGLVRAVECSQSFDAVAARAIADRPGVIEICLLYTSLFRYHIFFEKEMQLS